VDVVTGAFSFTGRAIAEELLRRGRAVRTLTRRTHPDDPLAARIESAPLVFDDPAVLAGAEMLYNTYWIRFPRGGATYAQAVEHTRALLRAAREVGVRRVVHISVTNPSEDSPLPYFHGKALLERDVAECGISYAIVRPTLVFGAADILLNNIAWCLRRSPLFPVPGDGSYRVQPVSVGDTARLAVDAGLSEEDVVLDAAGPETYTYEQLVRLMATAVGRRPRLVHVPPRVAVALARLVGVVQRDVMLTSEELRGLMASLLVSHAPPLARESFRAWCESHAPELGHSYVSELARNFRPYR